MHMPTHTQVYARTGNHTCMDGWVGACMDVWMDGWVLECVCEYVRVCVRACVDRFVLEYVNG